MESNYKTALELSNASAERYASLNTVSESKTACRSFQNIGIKEYFVIKSIIEERDKKIADIKGTRLPSIANPEIQVIRNEADREIGIRQDRLKKRVDDICKAKNDAAIEFRGIAPSPEQMRSMQTIDMIGIKNIPQDELIIHVNKLSTNPQCCLFLETRAKEAGIDFKLPSTFAEDKENIEQFRMRANAFIDNITDPYSNSYALEFFRNDIKDSYTSILIDKLDSQRGTVKPDPSVSDIGRLKAAAQNALHNGHFDLFNEIYSFIGDNRERLATPTEIDEAFALAVEKLIDAGNNAKEDKRTPYERKRDETISHLEQMTDSQKGDE